MSKDARHKGLQNLSLETTGPFCCSSLGLKLVMTREAPNAGAWGTSTELVFCLWEVGTYLLGIYRELITPLIAEVAQLAGWVYK